MSNVKPGPAWLTRGVADSAVAWLDDAARRKAGWERLDVQMRRLRQALAAAPSPTSSALRKAPREPAITPRVRPVGHVFEVSIADLPNRPCLRCGERGWCGHDGRVRN